MLSILVRLDILMRMEKNGVSLNFHVSHISIFDTPSRTPSSPRLSLIQFSRFLGTNRQAA
jgi:hypothetical protein